MSGKTYRHQLQAQIKQLKLEGKVSSKFDARQSNSALIAEINRVKTLVEFTSEVNMTVKEALQSFLEDKVTKESALAEIDSALKVGEKGRFRYRVTKSLPLAVEIFQGKNRVGIVGLTLLNQPYYTFEGVSRNSKTSVKYTVHKLVARYIDSLVSPVSQNLKAN